MTVPVFHHYCSPHLVICFWRWWQKKNTFILQLMKETWLRNLCLWKHEGYADPGIPHQKQVLGVFPQWTTWDWQTTATDCFCPQSTACVKHSHAHGGGMCVHNYFHATGNMLSCDRGFQGTFRNISLQCFLNGICKQVASATERPYTNGSYLPPTHI